MDAYRHGDQFLVHFDLPGADPSSIELTVEKNVLTVKAERRWQRGEGDEVLVAERPQGSFTRQLFLGETLDTDHIDANYENGVLTLTILLLAGIPRCLATFAIAEARAHGQVGFIVRLRAQNFVVAIGLALVLAPQLGVSGMALAWLGAQVLSGAVALRRVLTWSPRSPEPTGVTS